VSPKLFGRPSKATHHYGRPTTTPWAASGCSWDVTARLCRASETTLSVRRTEWLAAGVFDKLVEEASAGYDKIIGLEPRAHRHRLRQEGTQGWRKGQKALTLGLRWPVERTNSWFSNSGQLRRNTDRFSRQRLGQVALAVALIPTVKLVKWAKRWTD
jgi:transposase